MQKVKQITGESREHYLVRVAIIWIEDNTGFVGHDDRIEYDEAECDGYCLAQDLRDEFDIVVTN